MQKLSLFATHSDVAPVKGLQRLVIDPEALIEWLEGFSVLRVIEGHGNVNRRLTGDAAFSCCGLSHKADLDW